MQRLICLPIYLLLLGNAFTGCKVSSVTTDPSAAPVPDTYGETSVQDTTNVADVQWSDYFSDPVLVSLIDTALQNNMDLQMALQRIKASRAEATYRKGLLFPSVDGVAWAGQERTSEYSVNWAGNEGGTYLSGDPLEPTYNDLYLGFQSSWEIDIWGKLKNKKQAAYSRYLASVAGKNWVITNLVAEITNTYYELLALDNELRIIRENIQLQENALSIVKVQKEAGVANELAVKQFQAQLLSFQSLEKETLQAITETENRLNFLLGRFPQPIDRDPAHFNDSIPRQIRAGIPSELLQNRPDIRQAELELTAAKADVKSARAAFYPSLNITAGMAYNTFNTQYLFITPQSLAYNLFGNLAAPLINRAAIKADFNSANAYQEEALYNYQEVILNGYMEVSNELSNIRNLDEIYSLKNQEVEVLTESIETASDLFRTGRATYLEVLLTQQNALQANLELINARKRQYHAVTNIYKALGGGWR